MSIFKSKVCPFQIEKYLIDIQNSIDTLRDKEIKRMIKKYDMLMM